MSLKRFVYDAFEGGAQSNYSYVLTNLILIVLIGMTIGAMILSSMQGIDPEKLTFFETIEIYAIYIFTAEYVLRVWSVPASRLKKYSHPFFGRLRYMVSPMALVDMLVVLPFYLSFFFPVHLFHLRLIRLLKLVRYSPALTTLGRVLKSEFKSWLSLLLIILILLIIVSTVMWEIERIAQPEKFGSIPAAMWWGVTTLATVGYGDVTPITGLGKLIGGIVQVVGVAVYSLPAAILASGYIREMSKRNFGISFEMVAAVPLFADLDTRKVAQITNMLGTEVVPPRYAILRRGEPAKGLYIIAKGEVEVDLPYGNTARLRNGDFFGENSLMSEKGGNTISVTSLNETSLLVLDVSSFQRLMAEWPEVREKIQSTADRRAQRRQALMEQHGTSKPAEEQKASH